MSSDYLNVEKECLATARRGVNWMLSQQAPDGSWKALDKAPVDAYYKAAWAFIITGETVAAERTLNYVRDNLLQPDGDFLPRNDPWYTTVHYQYANAWILTGAQKQGRYDVAAPALRFLLTQQDPWNGGFYSLKGSATQRKRTDTMSSGIAGVSLLAAGQLEASRRLASYFDWIAHAQPDPQSKFYLTADENGHLVTEFPADEAFWRVVDTKQKDQCWYAVGLPFTFSTLLYQATGEKHYWDIAKWYFDFQSRCVNPWDGGSSGKAGWGCSVNYRITGDTKYRDIALRVAKNQ
ncbi:MAG: hypothetical protein OK456_02105, partial [Thaumarchaeota archaeon]|nr:hypothetical protein [Nitrososphaerota archaeon]